MLCISNHLKYLKSWRIIKIHLLANTFKTFLIWKKVVMMKIRIHRQSVYVTKTHTAVRFCSSICPAEKLSRHSQVPTCAPTLYPLTTSLSSLITKKSSQRKVSTDYFLVVLFLQCVQAVLWLGKRWFYIQLPLVVSMLTFFLNKLLLICCHNCDNKVLFLLFNGHGKLKLKEYACYS